MRNRRALILAAFLFILTAASGCQTSRPSAEPGAASTPAAPRPLPSTVRVRSDTLSATGPCQTGGSFASTLFGPIFEAPQQSARIASQDLYPRYPSELQRSQISGKVRASFIIDERGYVELMSAQIVTSSHPYFSIAVCRYLADARYTSAVHEGRNVRHQVKQEFYFQVR